jgi:hypothetical protein
VNILKITFKSVKRRYRQIIRAALTTLFVVFFVTAVLIFQENMYQWQMQSNKDRFGDWFIMDIGSRQPDSNLTDHIYIEQPVKVSRSVNVLNDDWQSTGFYVGSFSSEFLAQSHIKLDEGRHPEHSDEIAMDWNTLLTLGYKGEIGESINLKYYDNNSIGNKEKRKDKTYTLVGIYRNYTNIWNNGKQIPSAVVVDSELSQFNYDTRSIFLYPIKSSIKTDDYKAVFDSIKEKTSKSYTYNSGVYDYKPWGSTSIYIYMYLIVMAIGITALSYQLIEYKNTRKASYKKYASLGADSSQLRRMYIIENALIIVPAALIGIIAAFLAGGIVGGILEGKAGYSFYTINVSIVLKSIASIVIAVVVEEIVGLLSNVMDTVKEKRLKAGSKKQIVNIEVRNKNTSCRKSKLKVSNVSRVITSRLMKRDGVGMIIGVRLFSLFICVVLVFSVLKITTSFDKYKKNNSLPDIYGYLDVPSSNYRTDMIYISYLKDFDNYPDKSLNMDEFTQDDLINKEYNSRNRYNIPYDELRQLILDNGMTALFTSIPYHSPDRIIKSNCAIMNSPLAKDGNNSLIEGVSSDVIDGLNEIPGIVSIDYSIFESERTWYWDNQDYHKMGIDKIIAAQKASSIAKTMKDPTYGSRYVFATEYVNPTKKIYDIASKYIDKSNINYDDFASGKQVIVFIQDNCEGDYDDTLKAGDTLYYNYYNVPFGQCNKAGYITSSNAVYPYDIPFFNKYNNSGKIDLQVELKDEDNPDTASTTYSFTQTDLEVETMFGACVAPKVAAVIKVTDEVKEDFNGIMPDYGYYTALASTELAKQEIDNQKDLMLRITGEELTDGIDFKLQYNQIKIDYDLSSTFSATNNKVALYLKSNNITYKSNVDSKNVYRTQLVNNILQYGITIMAVIIIQLLIMAIIIRNRIESRRGKFILFRKMGMTRGKLLGICMREAIRESLWCIVTLPLMLILEVLIYSSNIRKL